MRNACDSDSRCGLACDAMLRVLFPNLPPPQAIFFPESPPLGASRLLGLVEPGAGGGVYA